MYLELTADHYRALLGLPADYRVAAFASYGSYDRGEHRARLAQALRALGVPHEFVQLKDFLQDVTEVRIGSAVCWFAIAYGGAQLSEYVHLASLLGSRRNLHLGSCGGLTPEADASDLVLPTWSYGNESITRMYARDCADRLHRPDAVLQRSLREQLKPGFAVREGPIMTTQAMLGQTDEDTRDWSRQGYVGIELETSTVFAVSRRFGVPAGALLYISDSLIRGQTVGDESYRAQREGRERAKDEIYRVGIRSLVDAAVGRREE